MTETKQQLQSEINDIETKDKEHTLAMRETKNEAPELRGQVSALANMIDKLSGKVEQKATRYTPRRRRSVSPAQLSENKQQEGAAHVATSQKKQAQSEATIWAR